MSVKNGIKDYFEMHKMERHGVSILLIILGVVFLVIFIIPYVVRPKLSDKEKVEKQIESILKAEREQANELAINKKKKYTTLKPNYIDKQGSKKKAKKLFSFDPNTCSDKDWNNLGLNPGQVKTLNKFKSKGGKFYKPSDLEKMYTISTDQYEELRPFIVIDKNQFNNQDKEKKKEYPNQWNNKTAIEFPKEKKIYLNLNKADTTELDELSGIGPYYARKIVEYRNKLGGFINQDQLLEIWNFKPEILDKISDQIHLGSDSIKQISINHCNAELLANHPYFNWKMANALVNYRETHGEYSSIEEITNSHLINEESCLKMKPYLKLN